VVEALEKDEGDKQGEHEVDDGGGMVFVAVVECVVGDQLVEQVVLDAGVCCPSCVSRVAQPPSAVGIARSLYGLSRSHFGWRGDGTHACRSGDVLLLGLAHTQKLITCLSVRGIDSLLPLLLLHHCGISQLCSRRGAKVALVSVPGPFGSAAHR